MTMSVSPPTEPAPAFVVQRRSAAPTATVASPFAVHVRAPDPALFKPGLEEASGRGAVGMTAGVLLGYALSYLYLVPMLGTAKTAESVTLMTTVVMASMLGLGTLGYLLLRRRPRAQGGPGR